MRGKEYSREFCLGQHSKTKVELNPSRQLRQLRHAVVRFWRWEGLSKEVRSKGNNGAGMLWGSRWKPIKRKEKQRATILNHVYYFLTSLTKSEMLRHLFKKYLLYHLKMICAWLCLCGYVHMSTDRFPGGGGRSSCELPDVCGWWELNASPLQEQNMLLTTSQLGPIGNFPKVQVYPTFSWSLHCWSSLVPDQSGMVPIIGSYHWLPLGRHQWQEVTTFITCSTDAYQSLGKGRRDRMLNLHGLWRGWNSMQ